MTDLASDYLDLDSLLSPGERELRERVRAFVDERIRPNIARWYETAHFPAEVAREMGTLGLLGMYLDGRGIRHRDEQGRQVLDESYFIWLNASPRPVQVQLPGPQWGDGYQLVLSTEYRSGTPRRPAVVPPGPVTSFG